MDSAFIAFKAPNWFRWILKALVTKEDTFSADHKIKDLNGFDWDLIINCLKLST